MSNNEIKHHLKQLHEELASITSADQETRNILRELDRDIHVLLEQEERAAEEVDSIMNRLDGLAIEFSTSHPKAGTVLRELMDVLVKIGI